MARWALGDLGQYRQQARRIFLGLVVHLVSCFQPELADRRQAAPVLRAAFAPHDRAMFRVLGIRQYLLLHRADD